MFHKIIKEICQELNIKYTYLSKDWIVKLEYNNKVKYLAGNKFDLNPHALGLVMDDKYAFYDTLKNLNLPVCLHHIFYAPNNKYSYAIGCNTYEEIFKYFDLYHHDIVVKINNGSLGMDVYHIEDKDTLIKTLDKLFIKNYSISICPYYHIKNEYRTIILNNEIKLIYKKISPTVTGDGLHSIKELLQKFNFSYFKDIQLPDTILKKGEIYTYDWHFNLSRGSIATTSIDPKLKSKITDLALTVAKKTGIVFASIDIIETTGGKLLVLEANSGVTIDKAINFLPDGYNIAKNIYKEAIIAMFQE